MSNEETKADFQRAEQLCQQARYKDALEILDRLAAALPSSRRILHQRAVCLIGMKRCDEAQKCCDDLEGKLQPNQIEALRTKIAEGRRESAGQASQPAASTPPARVVRPQAPPPAERAVSAPPPAPPADASTNVFQVESVFPLSTNETTITGRVVAGVFYTGDTVSVLSPTAVPLLAPIVRIGSVETPVRMMRQGQQGMIVLRIEPQHVCVGARITSTSSSEAYAETIVVSAEREPEERPAPSAAEPTLKEAEALINQRQFVPAKERLEGYLAKNPFSGAAQRLLARIHLEADGELQDSARALEHIQKAYELGGDKDAAVLETLAKALGAAGRAEHGIRYLERLHSLATTEEAREALAKRVASYRTRFKLGNVWEFMNSWGDVIFESGKIEEIEKAIANGSIPKDAQCRKNKTGEWRSIEQELAPQFPQLAPHFRAPKNVLPQWVAIGVLAGLGAGAAAGFFIPAVSASRPALAVLVLATTVCGALAGTLMGLQAQAKQKAPARKK